MRPFSKSLSAMLLKFAATFVSHAAGETEGLRTCPGPREDHRRYRFHGRAHVPHEMVCSLAFVPCYQQTRPWNRKNPKKNKPHQIHPGTVITQTNNNFSFFSQEKFGRGRPGPSQGGERQVSPGGHLVLRGAAHLALLPHRGGEEGGQDLRRKWNRGKRIKIKKW